MISEKRCLLRWKKDETRAYLKQGKSETTKGWVRLIGTKWLANESGDVSFNYIQEINIDIEYFNEKGTFFHS